MVRIGIIGCGQISKFHYEGYAKAGAKIAHVCDLRPDVGRPVADRYGAKFSTDYRALIGDADVDLVAVLTTAASHREICLAAMAAGKGVVCEKTLSDTPAVSAEIARAAEQAGTFFATAYMKRFFPAAIQARKLLDGMGQIISVYARSFQPWNLWTAPLPQGFLEKPSHLVRNYGGGAVVCCGSHVVDLIHWLAGRPTRIAGQLHHPPGADFDIQANAMMWMEQGGVVHFETCWHPLKTIGLEHNGWDEKVEITTVTGRLEFSTVVWNNPVNPALLVHHDDASGKTVEYRYEAMNPFDAEMAEMVRRFEAGEKGLPSAWDGYVVDEILAAIVASARQNTLVEMKWRDRTPC